MRRQRQRRRRKEEGCWELDGGITEISGEGGLGKTCVRRSGGVKLLRLHAIALATVLGSRGACRVDHADGSFRERTVCGLRRATTNRIEWKRALKTIKCGILD